MTTDRRSFLRRAATSVAATGAVSSSLFHTARALAQTAPAAVPAAAPTVFNPQPGEWRSFDVTTRVDIAEARGLTQAWLPVPSVDSTWQHSLTHDFTSNGKGNFVEDGRYGARMLHVVFNEGEKAPFAFHVDG